MLSTRSHAAMMNSRASYSIMQIDDHVMLQHTLYQACTVYYMIITISVQEDMVHVLGKQCQSSNCMRLLRSGQLKQMLQPM